MISVQLDTEDVEVLLFAAAAAGTVKTYLKGNQQFAEIEDRLPDTLDRVGKLWRGALRQDAFPHLFADASEAEIRLLRAILSQGGNSRIGASERVIGVGLRDLVRRGFVELGVHRDLAIWDASQTFVEHTERRVRLTARAVDVLLVDDDRLRVERLREIDEARRVAEAAEVSEDGAGRGAGENHNTDLPASLSSDAGAPS